MSTVIHNTKPQSNEIVLSLLAILSVFCGSVSIASSSPSNELVTQEQEGRRWYRCLRRLVAATSSSTHPQVQSIGDTITITMSNLSGEELPLVLPTDSLMLDLYRVAEGMLNARIHIFDSNRELRPTYEQLTALGIVHGTRLTYVIRDQITITLFDVGTNEELPLVVPAYAMTAELYNIAESMLDRGIAILDPDGELIPNYFDPNNIKHLIDLGIVNGTRLQCISEGHEYNFRP